MRQPFFSIVIPTKDRPECVEILLESIKRQKFTDYEVIVSDNASEKFCRGIVNDMKDSRFVYFKNETTLGICDSFEAAIRHAGGKWIMMFGDKDILYPDALEKLHDVIVEQNPEIINFGHDSFVPVNSEKSLIYGKLKKVKRDGRCERVNVKKALADHLSCKYLMAGPQRQWYLGNIYSGGVYRQSFLEKIRASHDSGRVFDGIVPDRYGAVEALCYVKEILWLNDRICIYNSCGKNTWAQTVKKGYQSLNDFVSRSRADLDYSDMLLIPGMVASVNNIIASDYRNAVSRAVSSNHSRLQNLKADRGYLAALVETELHNARNISDAVLKEQKQLLRGFVEQLDESEKESFEAARKRSAMSRTVFIVKSGIDRLLRKGMDSEFQWLQKIGTGLEMAFSKDTVIIHNLSDLECG